MGIKDILIDDINNLFFNDDNFFTETVTYSVLNTNGTFTDSSVTVNLSRKQEYQYDDADSGEVIPAHLFIRSADIAIPKYGDKITDSTGKIWYLRYQMSSESGLHKWIVHSDIKQRFNRY
jgi:hypothetical protein